MQIMNLMRDPVLQKALNKDDAVQTDKVNFEGENKEADQAQFEDVKYDSRFPNRMIRFSKQLLNNGFNKGNVVKTPLFEFTKKGIVHYSGMH